LLTDFVREHESDARSPEVQQAVLMLAGLHLRQFDASSARLEFQSVAERAKDCDPQLHAAALYGLHEALLMSGEKQHAHEALLAIVADHPDLPAAQAARIALAHLDHESTVQVGQPLPPLAYGTDLDDLPLNEHRFAPGPRLLVFWSLAHAPSQRRLEDLFTAWHQAGMPVGNFVAYALEDADVALRRTVSQHNWRFPVLPADGFGYLHPDWLRLGVSAVPTMFLVDADRRLLARDLTPDRLLDLIDR
jgi:hypothetical protein